MFHSTHKKRHTLAYLGGEKINLKIIIIIKKKKTLQKQLKANFLKIPFDNFQVNKVLFF